MLSPRGRRLAATLLIGLISLQPLPAAAGLGWSGPRGGTRRQLTITGNKATPYPRRAVRVTDLHTGWAFGGGWPVPGDTLYNFYGFSAWVDTVNVMAQDSIGVDVAFLGSDWATDIFENAGDLVMSGAQKESVFTATLARLTPPVWADLGNHEFSPADTLPPLQRSPAQTSTERFAALFHGNRWYSAESPCINYFSAQNSAEVERLSHGGSRDYSVNNPTTYDPPSGGRRGYDYDGIDSVDSPQRVALRRALATRDKWKWFMLGGNRAICGSNAAISARQNMTSAMRGSGYINEVCDTLAAADGERGANLDQDEHLTYVTEAFRDSHLCAAGEAGMYFLNCNSGSGQRSGDTTSVVPAGLRQFKSYYFRNIARTSEGIVDTMTTAGDPDKPYAWTWQELIFWGNTCEVRTFRIFTRRTQDNAQYPGHLVSKRIDRQFLYRRGGG